MSERLRNVLNWTAFVISSMWGLLCVVGIVIGEYGLFHFIGLFLLVYVPLNGSWQILQYIVWGGFKFIPWKKS